MTLDLAQGITALWAASDWSTTIYFVWDAVTDADSYVLEVGTTSGGSERFDADVGNVLTYPLVMVPGTYWSRTKAVIDSVEQSPVPSAAGDNWRLNNDGTVEDL